jgi:hypothetical protein
MSLLELTSTPDVVHTKTQDVASPGFDRGHVHLHIIS